MKNSLGAVFVFALLLFVGCVLQLADDGSSARGREENPVVPANAGSGGATGEAISAIEIPDAVLPDPEPIAPFVKKGVAWLAAAQHENGGWGAGSHVSQQLRDPHKVKVDPATTAFSAMALLRAGHTPTSGEYRDSVRRATAYLAGIVEECASNGARVTDITGTQLQTKLGPLIDTSMTVQFLARVLTVLPKDDELHGRVDAALDKALLKLQGSQKPDGSWGGGGWASVLQSSAGCSALEFASAAGKKVDLGRLERARELQKRNFNVDTGFASAPDSAGVELYAFAGSQKAAASEAKAAQTIVARGQAAGLLSDEAEVSDETLRTLGVAPAMALKLSGSYALNAAQLQRLDDDKLLSGFGNNGGEEFLSYMLTSEAMVLTGGEEWQKWNDKMHGRLQKVQSPDGSWTGHHCITSPVFCTAAAVQCLTADRDAAILNQIAAAEVSATEKNTDKK